MTVSPASIFPLLFPSVSSIEASPMDNTGARATRTISDLLVSVPIVRVKENISLWPLGIFLSILREKALGMVFIFSGRSVPKSPILIVLAEVKVVYSSTELNST